MRGVEWEKVKFGGEEGKIRGCWLERAVTQWWSMISKIHDELSLEDKSRKEGLRRILSTLNGFFSQTVYVALSKQLKTFFCPLYFLLNSLMDFEKTANKEGIQSIFIH